MNRKGIIYLAIASLTFAFTDKAGINSGVDPAVFSFFRIFFGVLIIGVIWFSFKKKGSLKFEKKNIKHLIIIGVLASGLSIILSISALKYTTATNKGIMQGLYTAGTMIMAYYFLREKLPKLYFPTFIVMIIGLIMLTSKGFLEFPNKGDWLLFLTIPIPGICNIVAKKSMKNIKPLTVSFGRYIFGAVFLLVMLPFFGLHNIATLQNGIIWVILSTMAATMLMIGPAITAISEYLFLDQKFNSLQILGLILVLMAAIVMTRFKAKYKKKSLVANT